MAGRVGWGWGGHDGGRGDNGTSLAAVCVRV